MTDHLPECPCAKGGNWPPGACICDRLRACEQRVRESEHLALITHGAKTNLAGYSEGYDAGLAAARDAVEALHYVNDMRNDTVQEALAAIDALRGES